MTIIHEGGNVKVLDKTRSTPRALEDGNELFSEFLRGEQNRALAKTRLFENGSEGEKKVWNVQTSIRW